VAYTIYNWTVLLQAVNLIYCLGYYEYCRKGRKERFCNCRIWVNFKLFFCSSSSRNVSSNILILPQMGMGAEISSLCLILLLRSSLYQGFGEMLKLKQVLNHLLSATIVSIVNEPSLFVSAAKCNQKAVVWCNKVLEIVFVAVRCELDGLKRIRAQSSWLMHNLSYACELFISKDSSILNWSLST
jgi:hypothetical protein